MLLDFGFVLIFLVLAALFIGFSLALSWFLRPKAANPEKLSTYECGERLIGPSWVQFNVRFYIIALVFIVFDVEVVLLYPWAVVFKSLGLLAFVEMMIFVAVLLVALIYVWKGGYLEWVKPRG
ncbi:MAG: NADH-quinone oxidoreductase subunit A [Thermodesulfobacteriota bacterium]